MNIEEKRNLLYRIVAAILLIMSLVLSSLGLYKIITYNPNELVIMMLANIVCAVFALLQIIFILKGGKKESNLYKIAFNENKHVNNVPLVAVIIGTIFGLGLSILGVIVFFVRRDVPTIKASMIAVISVGVYLLVNTLIYYFYLFLFRNREINLKDFL